MIMKKNKLAGITLIELLIAVAIVMIIAAIAFPSYQAQVEKSRRTEARAALANIQLAQERFFTINGRYADGTASWSLGNLDLATGLTNVGTDKITTDQGLYNITLDAGANATSYTLNATAVGAQAGDTDCAFMSIDHLGVKAATNTAKCW
jgi:type IV pilus assembly protein PilE